MQDKELIKDRQPFFKIGVLVSGLLLMSFFMFQSAFAAYTLDFLIVSLNLDENSGTTAADSSGSGYNGIVAGAPTWSGGNIFLDGNNDKITITSNSVLNGPSHTYEAWFTMPDSTSWSNMTATFPRIIDKIPSTNDSGININIDKSTRKVQGFLPGSWENITVGNATLQNLISSVALSYSTTYHIVFTYDDLTKIGKIYLNNVLVASATASANYISNSVEIGIGGKSADNTRNLVGTLHRASIYNKALSAGEVSLNYAEGKDYNYNTTPDPEVVSASQSTVIASTNSVRANGTASTTITVTAKNYLGDVLSGKTVSLSSSRGATDTITPSSVTTDVFGIATFTIKSTTTGSPVITATAGGVTLNTTQTIAFTEQYVSTTGITYISTLDSLSMKMDVAYDSDINNAPIVIDLHGYSGPYSGTDIIQRLARKGVFAIKTYKRGYGGSQGIQDDSGREIYDFYDAVEYVKTNYSNYVDPNNINIIGYSGGGGNSYGLITKFPDYFRSANIFFGMSDYCYDPTYSWWFNGDSSYRTGMQSNIGGTPVTVADNCYSRAHYLGAKNNPYSHIQLFYDTSETIVPLSHGTQYTSQNTAAGFSNVTTRISNSSSTTTESSDNFSTNLSDYSFVGNGATKFTWNNSGHIDWSGDRTSTFSSIYKKFTSLRSYGKVDRLKASFNFTVSATETNGVVFFGFRNSADMAVKNAVSIIVLNQTPSVRIDYNGTALDLTNRDFTTFTTTLSIGTTYGFDLEINNSVVTAILKDASGTTLETKTVNFHSSKGFDGVDSFGIYNFNSGDTLGTATGTFDNLAIDAYARWIHGYPQEGAGTAEGNITAENYFVSDMVAGTWSQPTLNTSGNMFIPGWVRTKKFQVFLGNGNDEAGNLTYDISGSAASVSSPKTLTVEGLTGIANISLKVYELTPNTEYNIKDSNLTDGGDTTTQATTDSNGTLSFSGILGSTHQYDIFAGSADVTSPNISSISAGSISTSGATITWRTDETATSQVIYGSTTSYGATTTLNATLVTSHSVVLSGLLEGTTYHYRVISTDGSNNTSTSTNQTFITTSQSSGSSSSSRYIWNPVVTPQLPNCPLGFNCTPVITATIFSRNLAFQARGNDVKTLQQFLISKNYLGKGNDTGYFGILTHQALVQYQKDMGIVPSSGYFGPITRSVVVTSTDTLPLTQITIPQVLVSRFTKDLKLGMTDIEVKHLQQYLNSKGFTVSTNGRGSIGLETLYFGPATQSALIKFQSENGIIPALGYFGPKTREYIFTHE